MVSPATLARMERPEAKSTNTESLAMEIPVTVSSVPPALRSSLAAAGSVPWNRAKPRRRRASKPPLGAAPSMRQ